MGILLMQQISKWDQHKTPKYL